MKKITLTDIEISHLRDFYKSELEAAKKRIAVLTSVLSKLGEITEADEKEVSKLLESEIEVSKKTTAKVVSKTGKKRGRPPKAKPAIVAVTAEINPKPRVGRPKSSAKKTAIVDTANAQKVEKSKAKKEKKVKAVKVKKAAETHKKNAKKVAKKRKTRAIRKPIKSGKGTSKVKWNDFIVNSLQDNNRLMHSVDITKLAAEKFGIPEPDMNRVKAVIAGTLTKLVKSKGLITYKKTGIRGNFYGLPEWVNEKGEPVKDILDKI